MRHRRRSAAAADVTAAHHHRHHHHLLHCTALQANFRFLVSDSIPDARRYAADPDTMLDWEDVVQVGGGCVWGGGWEGGGWEGGGAGGV